MGLTRRLALSAGVSLAFCATALAGDMAHRTVENVIAGYGGSKFQKLTTVKIKSDLRYGWLGQGQYPDYTDLEPMRKVYHFDLSKGWGSEEAWGGGGSYAERVFAAGDGQYTVNYLNNFYEHDEDANFYSHFGGEIRTSDILLAYDLMKHRNTAKLVGERLFRGAAHDLVTYDMPGTEIDPILWVDRETGLISKMRRDIPDVYALNYVFGNYKSNRGIRYSADFELYVGDKLIEYAKSVEVFPGRVSSKMWKVEAGVASMPETIESAEMVVDHIQGEVHFAGLRGAWSAFVDAGDHIIGIGGYGGLAERFTAYQSEVKNTKPLKYQIITHHHEDHLEGAPDALTLGAKIIATEAARANLEKVAERVLSEAELMIVDQEKTSLGPVDIHLISTAHAPEFALPFIRSEKIIYDEDHYNGRFKDSASYVSSNAMSLIGEVNRIGLAPETLLSTHSRKPEKWADILLKSKEHKSGLCPTGREICRDLIK